MGAWGYGYKDNDDYYNEASEFVHPLIEALETKRKIEYSKLFNADGTKTGLDYAPEIAFGAFRSQLMWTFKVLSATEENVSFSEEDFKTLSDSVALVREAIELDSTDARDTEKFVAVLTEEMDEVQKWLDGFGHPGFLDDRLGAILDSHN